MKETVTYIRQLYGQSEEFIPLHEPRFRGKEKDYLLDVIDSTFISSVGPYVNRFEEQLAEITGARYAVACVNGTAALQVALLMAGVEKGHEVITQPLTFVATANAIAHCQAVPHFVDVDRDTLGMSPEALERQLTNVANFINGRCYNKLTGRPIQACLPMHTFGFPARIEEIAAVCKKWNIALVEDAAESLGSTYNGQHTGTFGLLGVFSFNGNKTITCGGGGAIITDEESLAKHAKHITTTAKLPHPWNYVHDEIAFNYRMPNLNAAVACAQLEQLTAFLESKRQLAREYEQFFKDKPVQFVTGQAPGKANYWLNTLLVKDKHERDQFLEFTNSEAVMTRPVWQPMHKLSMFEGSPKGDTFHAEWLEERIVNIPSSVR